MKNLYKYLIILIFLTFISCSGGGGKDKYQYLSHEEINEFLDEIKLHYPSITSIETVGYSQSGRVIKALVISSTPGAPGVKPAVRLTGGIHGDEKMSIELLVKFIEYLTSNYGADSTVTNMVNTRYICIIPVFNPDGLEENSRYNIRGVDLNRNFNDAGNHWSAGSHQGTAAFSESETQAMVSFSSTINFNLSITYHVGSVLVNLPFDYALESVVKPNEYLLIKSYAKTYTNAAGGIFLTNPDLYNSSYMDEGTINGGNWYIITGSLQDWSYTVKNCLDLTIEVSRKNPDTEKGVEKVFMYNRDSIMEYINLAGNHTFDGL